MSNKANAEIMNSAYTTPQREMECIYQKFLSKTSLYALTINSIKVIERCDLATTKVLLKKSENVYL